MPPADSDAYLELSGVRKTFPGVVANDDVDLCVRRGEIHGLLGENGAGKSTLMNVLYGLYDRDAGSITLDGEPFDPDSPAEAIDSGVGMVHQHFMLIPRLTVAENVVLGDRAQAGRGTRWAESLRKRFASTAVHDRFVAAGLPDRLASLPGASRLASVPVGVGDALTLDMETPTGRIRELTAEYGLDVPPGAPVRELTVGERQRVEILKALFRDVELLVLDEPTAVLAPDDAERLFETLERLAERGITVIFITHKLEEVTRLTDRVTVLRDGERVDTVETDAVSEDDLARLMVGRDVLFDVDRPPAEVGDPVLEATGLETEDERGFEVLSGVDLTVRSGEVVGVAGVSGNGQVDLAESLVGVHDPASGSVRVGGRDLTGQGPRAFLDAGVSYVPADRLADATAPDLSVMHNLMLKSYREDSGLGRLDYDRAAERARRLVSEFDVRGVRDVRTTPAGDLSGGNLQKLVLARELGRDPGVLVAHQPTRGVDVGAVEFLREAILDQRADGTGVVLLSENLDEVFALSDRILVLSDGEVVAETTPEEADRGTVGLWMGGTSEDPPGGAEGVTPRVEGRTDD
ncbi:MAG: ABC transporter ATP-binding protein [Haloarculaceae archaeon]